MPLRRATSVGSAMACEPAYTAKVVALVAMIAF